MRCKTKSDYYKLSGWCRECQKENSKRNGNEHKEERSIRFKNWYEDNKDYKQKCNRDYLDENKEEVRKYVKSFQQEYPERVRGYNENRVKKNHQITNAEWENCKLIFNNACAYCGLPLEDHYYKRNRISKLGDFHKEHVDDQGVNDLSNCVPSCGSCNSKKWEYNFDDWYNEDNPIYSKERYNKIIWWTTEGYKNI